MPIPTDTYWNIRRLNWGFAISAVLLTGVTVWAIMQDHDRAWRIPQRHAKVWQAALVNEKIQRDLTPEHEQRIAELEKQIADRQSELQSRNRTYQDLNAQVKKLDSDRATLEFALNNLKSNVAVDEASLQDAIAANDPAAVQRLTAKLAEPRKRLSADTEHLASLNAQLAERRKELSGLTADIDARKKQLSDLTSDAEGLRKKLESLQPGSIPGKLSSLMRDAPLLDFINPSEKVQQDVLPDVQTDVAFMKITTIDRCRTCHVNIANKDFTAEKVIAYLEEQAATSRGLNLPEEASGKASDPAATRARPGAVAMPEFWHAWARALAPELIRKNSTRLGAVARSVGKGKPAAVTYDGQPVGEFKYDPALADQQQRARQDEILLSLIDALSKWNRSEVSAGRGKASVQISAKADEKTLTTARNSALRYAEELKSGLRSALKPDAYALLEDRYRHALTEEVNVARRQQGMQPLDASPVLLAHPRLDLYVDVDSPHSFEAVGCTSCHDGSGQETDFVLAAHSPRSIYVDARTGVPVLPAQLLSSPHEKRQRDLSSMLDAVVPEEAAIPKQVADLHFEMEPAAQPASQPAAEPTHSAARLAYVDPVTGKTAQAVTQMDYWKAVYEPKAPRNFELVYHEWDWPMRPPQYLQANCARCHSEIYDIKETAPVLYEGRQMFAQLGCANCHQMDSIPASENRKVGTDLRHVNDKLSPEFINTWIWAPKSFRPTTKMPHFFMLENNSSDEEIKRTRQEARAITEYLVHTATPLPPKYPLPTGAHGSAEAGKAIFNSIGCLACHQNLNERGQEWITTDLVKRAGMKADEAMAAYTAMNYNERQLYVQQHLAEPAGHMTPAKYADGTPRPLFVQVGPELSGIGTKLTAGRSEEQARQWLFDWLKEPRHYSAYTIMPRLRLNDQQAMDLIEYLLAQKRTTADPKDKWSAGLTPPDTGKLIELTSLFLRSRYSAATALVKANDDVELTALAADALTTPQKPADEARSDVAKMSRDEKRLVFLGKKLIAHYGCMSCHAINGAETISSPCANLSDWGQKGVDKLDFGYLDHHKLQALPPRSALPMVNGLSAEASALAHEPLAGKPLSQPVEVAWPQVEHSRVAWITQKLGNTRIYDRGRALLEPDPGRKLASGALEEPGKPYDKLKMPTFYLNEEQVHAIVTFVISNRDRLISDRLLHRATNEAARVIARGRELTERYNCVSCHQIEQNLPQVQQYYKVDEVITKAPPSLRGEGNKIQHSWLFNFFRNVEPLRPLLFTGIRMPSFPGTDDEFTAIIAYFNTVSNKESKQLARQLDPVTKYIAAQQKPGAATRPATRPSEPAPGDDWWTRPELAASTEYLRDWALEHRHINQLQIDPTKNTLAELNKSYRIVLFRAMFTRELYDAPYPFVDSPRPEIPDDRLAKGEHFFYAMQCLKCHVLGDPAVPGANRTPTAPNLSLAHRRLQRRWVRHWVQEPDIIQKGTAMPPFFTAQQLGKLDGQPWPKSQGADAAEVQRVEAVYGDNAEAQTDLLLDFLYAAGVRGITGVQPSAAASAGHPAQSSASAAAHPATAPTQDSGRQTPKPPTIVPTTGGAG